MNNDLGEQALGMPTITQGMRDAMRLRVAGAVARGSITVDEAGEIVDMLGLRGNEMLSVTERLAKVTR